MRVLEVEDSYNFPRRSTEISVLAKVVPQKKKKKKKEKEKEKSPLQSLFLHIVWKRGKRGKEKELEKKRSNFRCLVTMVEGKN